MKRIPKWLRNKYVVITIAFVLWMLFFDHDDLISQWHLSGQIRDLQREKAFYEQQIEQAEQQRAALQQNPTHLLQFARTHYFFKPPQADLYQVEFQKTR
ncbi:MAG: hypothetical protein K6T34_04845 [Thermoflavifilum sp.]|nr:hypothetical protein [Thermoflavifilum sp.]